MSDQGFVPRNEPVDRPIKEALPGEGGQFGGTEPEDEAQVFVVVARDGRAGAVDAGYVGGREHGVEEQLPDALNSCLTAPNESSARDRGGEDGCLEFGQPLDD